MNDSKSSRRLRIWVLVFDGFRIRISEFEACVFRVQGLGLRV